MTDPRQLGEAELYAHYGALMDRIARLVADVRAYVPAAVAKRREALEAEILRRAGHLP